MRSFKPHRFFMRKALEIAEKGRGRTYPNPLVGAVVVKNGKIVSQGYHRDFGGPHAEVDAIRKAGKKAAGSTLYVTLEPCSTYGKTPPCTEWIAKSKIRKVIFSAKDPDPRHSGKGISELRKMGIRVSFGELKEESIRQNEVFFKWTRTGLPFVSLKMAQTLDGKIATKEGRSKWITGPRARNWVHRLRAENQAVLVGKRTVLADNPRLFSTPGQQDPVRIVIDSRLEIPLNKKIFRLSSEKTLVICGEAAYRKKYSLYDRRGIALLAVPLKGGNLDLRDLLKKLSRMGIISILIEGGGETAAHFFKKKLVDKIYFFVAPKILGGREAITSVEGAGVRDLDKTIRIRDIRMSRKGDDFLFEGYPVYAA